MLEYTHASSVEDLQQILHLQQLNLKKNISLQESQEQGFVTVEHSLDLLTKMNATYPHIIAKSNGQVVGYALVMLQEFKYFVPILQPMFEKMDGLILNGKPIKAYHYFVLGQICIAKDFRGQGLFGGLYKAMKQQMQPHFELLITEISLRNTRSLRAHEKVGFTNIHEYVASNGEYWAIVAWDWQQHEQDVKS